MKDTPYSYLFSQGIQVLYERFPSLEVILLPGDPPFVADPPEETEFLNQVGSFWLQAVHVGQPVQHGEYWFAGQNLYGEVRESLQCLIGWHARFSYKGSHPVYRCGRRIETRADPRVVAALPDCSGNVIELGYGMR